MKRLPILSSDELLKILKQKGFQYAPKRGKGSHIALCKVNNEGKKLLVIVPKRKEIPKGTLLAIIDQAGMTKEEFLDLT